jgi:hypothetical protein
VAELRIKELQQKLDLEATTKRRLEVRESLVGGWVYWSVPLVSVSTWVY